MTYDFERQIIRPGDQPAKIADIALMNEGELLVLRAQIDALLPVTKLSDMNLERELTLQLRSAQTLQQSVLDDEETPANQKAQVMNSVANTLQHLVKMQVEYYTPERLKLIEAALVRTLKEWPDEQTHAFFQRYEALLNAK